MKTLLVFDLDGTVIDSSHRARHDAQGRIDLPHWLEHSTWEHISKDSLMPLAAVWKAHDGPVAVITARALRPADRRYLKENGLHADWLLCRDGDDDPRGSVELKFHKFHELRDLSGVDFEDMRYYEDHEGCLEMAARLGVDVVDAKGE